MNEFFDDFLNETHDADIASQLRNLKKEYTDRKDRFINSAGEKIEMARQWKQRTGQTSKDITKDGMTMLDDEYKDKVIKTAKPGIDNDRYDELVKKHSPQKQKQTQENRGDTQSQQDKQKAFLQQFKSNGISIGKQRDDG